MKCMSAIFLERERGFAAIVAVFILVVLGMLGAVLVTVSSAQHRGLAFDALGTRVYQAARAGTEYGAARALAGTCANVSFGFPGSTLSAFNVQVNCTQTNVTEGVVNLNAFEIVATACNQPACPVNATDGTYVERQLRLTVVSQAP